MQKKTTPPKNNLLFAQPHQVEDYEYTSGLFSATDGKECFWQAWIGDPAFSSNIIIHHGLGEHSGRYINILSVLAGEKVNVFSYDARGHGRSKGPRGSVKNIEELVSDLDCFLSMLEKDFHVKKPLLYGHSMGALVVLSFALLHSNQQHLRAIAVNGAALQSILTAAQKIKLYFGRILCAYFPKMIVSSGLSPKQLSRDTNLVQDYLHDPLVHDRISLSLASSLVDCGALILQKAVNLQIPIFIAHGQKDSIVNSSGSVELHKRVSSKNKRLAVYSGLCHEIHNAPPAERQKPLHDLKEWILEHTR